MPPSALSTARFVNPQLGSQTLGSELRTIPAGGDVPLPAAPDALQVSIAGAGRMFDLDEWNAFTHGTSLLVVRSGCVIHEWYAEGLGVTDLMLGMSMTKSELAHLAGRAVRQGALRLGDRVVDHVPELGASGYAGCRVIDVLTMTTGVDWVEDHRDPGSPASRLVECFGSEGDSRALLRRIGRRDDPGVRFEYSTADSQVLDWVRERATGSSYVDAVGALWGDLGCTDDAVLGVDGKGVALAGGGLAATARDWARVGMLQLDGTVERRRLLDEGWLAASTRPAYRFLAPGRLPSSITAHAGFGFHWWPTDLTGCRATADGSRGQFCYVDRDRAVVVVKTSQWPYDDAYADRQFRDLSYLGLAEIARVAGVVPIPEGGAA